MNKHITKLTKKEPGIINRELPSTAILFEIQSNIEEIKRNSSLYVEKSFTMRMETIDYIEFHVIDQLEELQKTTQSDQVISLKDHAEKIKDELEEINNKLFKKLRANIRAAGYTGKEFKDMVNEYIDHSSYSNGNPEEGYDNLDTFINGLMPFQIMPEQTKDLEPEMVFYQKTPARIVFEFVEKSYFVKEDVFFDLGSGLGQVAILVNLLTGITVKGVEFEPAFCDYARDCAAKFNLPNVTFINADARKADYSEGTIFFMFTPFKGEMLQDVLEILRKEALLKKIKIITYGPCTAQVALQNWLHPITQKDDNIYKPGFFTSF